MPITRTCRISGTEFTISDAEITLLDKLSPVIGGEKFALPLPTLCPDFRQQRRLSWRNERRLYKRKCDATSRDIISIYSLDKPYTVYNQEYWWSDSWDPLSYGKEFDFSRGAMRQFGELMKKVPKQAIHGFGNANCDYTNYLANSKDCYGSVAGVENEGLLYCYWMTRSTDSLDSMMIRDSSHLYECYDCENCHNCTSCVDCKDCDFCFFSEGLRGKSYCFKNTQYTKEEIYEMISPYPRNIQSGKCDHIIGSENSTGKKIYYSKNIHASHQIENSEDCSYGSFGINIKDSLDFDYDSLSAYVLESHTGYKNYHSGFLAYGNELIDSWYCIDSFASSHLFLCTGLRNKSYCILNRQYTKVEYEELVPRIIKKMILDGEWGEFFPSSMSPFGYNETVANEYFPLTREEALYPSLRGVKGNRMTKQSSLSAVSETPGSPRFARDDEISETFVHGPIFNWSDYETPFPRVEKIIPALKLPDTIESIPDDILNWAIECEVSKRLFRIIRQELEFYRKHNLPIPRRHPDVRHMDRMKNYFY